MRLLLCGGRARADARGRPEWQQYDLAVLGELDTEAGTVRQVFAHTPPPEVLPPPEEQPSLTFKAGHLEGERLFACTQTQVLEIDVATSTVQRSWSLPCFNDLHHARPLPDGHLGVVTTGLDAVALVEPDTGAFELRSVLGAAPPPKWDASVDFRRLATTKPHAAHPNFLFLLDGVPWVTRFEQRDAVCLDDPGRVLDVGVERPHDGIVHDGAVWFTTVDGHVVACSPHAGAPRRVWNLNLICDRGEPLGWCRGLCHLGGNRWAVGFSALRATRFLANVRWVARRLGRRTATSLPARVVIVDLDAERVEAEVFTHEAGLDAIFSIHRLE